MLPLLAAIALTQAPPLPALCADAKTDAAVCARWCATAPAGQACLVWLRFGTNGVAAWLASTVETDRPLPDLARQQGLTGADVTDFNQFLEARRLYDGVPAEAQAMVAETGAALGELVRLVDAAQYEEAAARVEAVYQRRLQGLGPHHPLTAQADSNAAFVEMELGHFPSAEARFLRALAARRKSLGAKDAETASSAVNLASLYQALGRFEEAAPLLAEALPVYERVFGPKHPNVAAVRSLAANQALGVGDLDTARRELERGVAALRLTQGADAIWTLQNTAMLGGVLTELGDLQAAIATLDEALSVAAARSGPRHPVVAVLELRLGQALANQGRLEDAVAALQAALDDSVATFGVGHPLSALALQALGDALRRRGRLAEAEQVLTRAVAQSVEQLGEAHFATQQARLALGAVFREAGALDKAVRELTGAVEGLRALLGPDHPQLAPALSELARTEQAAGDLDAARGHAEASLQLYRANLLSNLGASGTDFGLLGFAGKAREAVDVALAVAPQRAWENLVAWQGVGTMLEQAWREARRHAGNGALWEAARVAERQAAKARSGGGGADALRSANEALAALRTRLEAEVPALAAARARLMVRPEDVCAGLGPKDALVSTLRVLGDGRAPRYEAWVVTATPAHTCAVRHVALGPGEVVDAAVAGFREAVEAAARCAEASCGAAWDAADNAALALSERVLAPLALSAPDTLYVVPDGRLVEVPWAVLPVDGAPLVARTAVAFLPYPAALAGAATGAEGGAGAALVVGDVDYDRSTALPQMARCDASGCAPAAAPAAVASASRSAGVCGLSARWPSLTPTEASSVALTLGAGGPTWLASGDSATEASIRAALSAGPRVAHFATHGFFSPASTCSGLAGGGSGAELADPLRLSAVVLSGANALRDAPPDRDGLLSARDIADLPLSTTSLVVLSACETGLGPRVAGEGVLGIARAFTVAGVGTTLAALWEVPNAETTELFTRFYASDEPPWRALASAQRALIARLTADEGRAPFTLWGAFVPIRSR